MRKIICYDLTKENMARLLPEYEYEIFISYRRKDNKLAGCVIEFVDQMPGKVN